MSAFTITYHFRYPDDRRVRHDLIFDAVTLELLDGMPAEPPPWTRLGFHQCPICPLEEKEQSVCPAAARLVKILAASDDLVSHDTVQLAVDTPERRISCDISAQQAVSSLMGLIMATCGCPHTDFLKPMARFHLPFATEEETLYRATTMYLLAQYYRFMDGHEPDLQLTELTEKYNNLHVINISLSERIRAGSHRDASLNALTILDCYAQSIPDAVDGRLREMRHLFAPYQRKHSRP